MASYKNLPNLERKRIEFALVDESFHSGESGEKTSAWRLGNGHGGG
jgi:hypothetical protein